MDSRSTILWELLNMSSDSADGAELAELSELSYINVLQLQEIMMNFTNHIDNPNFDLMKRPAWRGLMLSLYVIIIVVGIIGNTIVFIVVAKNKAMQTVTNIFIANLALGGIGLCVFSLPVQLYYQITDQWIFGMPMCKMIFAAFAVPMYVSTLTILLIAFDRYWLILYPLKERMSVRAAMFLIVLVIVVSILLAIPVMCYTTIKNIDHPDLNIFRVYCIEQWPNKTARQVYSTLTFLLQFCLPLILTTLLYYRIYDRLKKRPTQQHNQNQDRKHKTNKILVAIVALFMICWLPWNLFSLIAEMDHTVVQGPHFKFVDLLLKVFAMGSTCVNPFLYCWLNENFRREIDNIAIKMRILREGSSIGGERTRTPTCQGNGRMEADGVTNGLMTHINNELVTCHNPTMVTSMDHSRNVVDGMLSP